MSEFNLSNTPNTSALIIVRGEVQENHSHNFHRVMKYGGELAVISTTELEEAMPMVGMRLIYRGDYNKEMGAMLDNRKQCAQWVAEHVSDRFGLEPFKYDVHLLDGAPDMPDAEGFDGMRPHWRGIAYNLTDRKSASYKNDGGTAVWHYKPFKLVDTNLTGVEQKAPKEQTKGKMMSPEELSDIIAKLRASKHPVQFGYATATLVTKCGDLDNAQVTFAYPTAAKFRRTKSAEPNTRNADGDTVIQTTEISRRIYTPEIPVELQTALDGARADAKRMREEAIERWGDADMYMMGDDGNTEYDMEARLAPVYNLF